MADFKVNLATFNDISDRAVNSLINKLVTNQSETLANNLKKKYNDELEHLERQCIINRPKLDLDYARIIFKMDSKCNSFSIYKSNNPKEQNRLLKLELEDKDILVTVRKSGQLYLPVTYSCFMQQPSIEFYHAFVFETDMVKEIVMVVNQKLYKVPVYVLRNHCIASTSTNDFSKKVFVNLQNIAQWRIN